MKGRWVARTKTESRSKKISKQMRLLDEATRKMASFERLNELEADKVFSKKANNPDELLEDEADQQKSPQKGSKRKTRRGGGGEEDSQEEFYYLYKPKGKRKERRKEWGKLPLQKILHPDYREEEEGVGYLRLAAVPEEGEKLPAIRLCSVCGFESKYRCMRCLQEYCSVRCKEIHIDIVCFKYFD